MNGIILFALPADRARAYEIVDAIKAARIPDSHPFRLMAVHPADAGWREAVRAGKSCPSVVFCWSRATAADDAAPFRAFADRVHAAGNAISVELAEQTRPASLNDCTTYRLYGWRAEPNWLVRQFFGNSLLNEIAAAAEEKAIGRDPPPPSAAFMLAWRQLPTKLAVVVTILGTVGVGLQFLRDPMIAKWLDPQAARAFEVVKASRSCDGLRKFGKNHNGSAWSSDASELLLTCHEKAVLERRQIPIALPFMVDGTIDDIPPSPREADAKSLALLAAQAKAKRICEDHAQNFGAALISTAIDRVKQSCNPTEAGVACEIVARAVCSVDQPVQVSRETVGGS